MTTDTFTINPSSYYFYQVQYPEHDPQKIAILERLLKDGHIRLEEALILLKTQPYYTYTDTGTSPTYTVGTSTSTIHPS